MFVFNFEFFSHSSSREENGEFCVAVAPTARTAGTLTQLMVKGAGC